VPFDVAFCWPPHYVAAANIAFGELEGGEFDWSAMQWKERKV
jgi:hypothetical protein